MEDKKLNELNDEALDNITGGAYYQYCMKTDLYDVFTKDGVYVSSTALEEAAKELANALTDAENKQPSILPIHVLPEPDQGV